MGPLEVEGPQWGVGKTSFEASGGSDYVSQTHRCLCCSLSNVVTPAQAGAQRLYKLTLGRAGQLLFCS